jgi:hypothetical protein
MKKTILLVLMALMIATPCFAQEVETESFFSVEGTSWELCGLVIINGPPFGFVGCAGEIGFYPGWKYPYVDLGLVSIAYDIFDVRNFFLAIMQPIGLGVFINCGSMPTGHFWGSQACMIGIMYKINDNWVPPYYLHSINPNSGYQGTTLTNVHLYADNTTFQDNPPVQIGIESPYGLAVSNINVRLSKNLFFKRRSYSVDKIF